MVIVDKLAEKIFGILKGFGHQVRMYNAEGAETVDPKEARRFFSSDQGMMVTIDEDDNEVVLNKSKQQPLEDTRQLQRNLKKLANQFLMNYTVRSYGKSIQPRDFSYKAKIQRNNNMAESNISEGFLDAAKKKAYYAMYNNQFGFDPAPDQIAIRIKDSSTELLKKIVKYGVPGKNSPGEIQTKLAQRELSKRAKRDNKPVNESDEELHDLLRKTKQKPLAVIVTKSRDKSFRPSELYTISDIDTDGGYEPTALFTDRKGNSRRGKLYDIDFRELKMNKVQEGLSKLSGSKKTSHQTLENVKILVKHKQAVDEERRGARSRNIQSIFLERDGERFRFPSNHLGGARAMARHMQEGGDMTDRVGNYIIESVSSLIKLQEFYRYAKSNKLINEDSEDIISTVRENINGLKSELTRLTGIKTYESIKSRIEESEELELHEDDVSSLRDMFTVKRFDEKFDDVLPVVSRLVQEKDQYNRRIEEAASNPVQVAQRAFAVDGILEFASEEAKLGHRLSEISSRIVENPELASFVSNIGRKLCKEGEINAFEKSVMQNVLGNMAPQQLAEEENTELTESKSFEKHFEKYNYIFL